MDERQGIGAQNAVFETSSAMKAFTSLLLADMVQHGEVALSDPLSKCLRSSLDSLGSWSQIQIVCPRLFFV
jgi:CubicO group peptidase (beta-lactamase class C family)